MFITSIIQQTAQKNTYKNFRKHKWNVRSVRGKINSEKIEGFFAAINVKTSIMCIRAWLRIKTTLTNSPVIRKKADYEYRYYKANGNGAVQNRR